MKSSEGKENKREMAASVCLFHEGVDTDERAASMSFNGVALNSREYYRSCAKDENRQFRVSNPFRNPPNTLPRVRDASFVVVTTNCTNRYRTWKRSKQNSRSNQNPNRIDSQAARYDSAPFAPAFPQPRVLPTVHLEIASSLDEPPTSE